IFIHEAGHFVVAKAVGIQVLRFSLGFGRPIVRWRRGETEYWISWIPFGGYVKMAGLEDEGRAGGLEGGASAEPIDPARAFDKKPVVMRLLVVCAGVTMNALLAFVIFAALAGSVGTPELNTTQVDSVVTAPLPAGARALASLAPGDRIVRINDDSIRTWDDVVQMIVSGPAEQRFYIAGRAEPVVIDLGPGGLAARQAVAEALVPRVPVVVQRLEEGRPAVRAGIKPGDVVVAVDGVPVRSVERFLEQIWTSGGRPVPVWWRRRRDRRRGWASTGCCASWRSARSTWPSSTCCRSRSWTAARWCSCWPKPCAASRCRSSCGCGSRRSASWCCWAS